MTEKNTKQTKSKSKSKSKFKGLFIKSLILLNILSVISLLLSYSSVYISPAKFSFTAFFGLAYPYILLLNLFFIVVWILLRNRWLLLSLIAVLGGYSYLNDFFSISFNKKENSHEYKILSYNVRLFDIYNWGKNWSYNKTNRNKIYNYLKNENADIICFQEYFADTLGEFSKSDSIAKITSIKNLHEHFPTKNKHHRFGIATFSRFPIINKGLISFQKSNNLAIYTDVVIEKDTIRIYNCHLRSIHFRQEDYNFVDSILNPKKEQVNSGLKLYKKLNLAFIKRAEMVDVISQHIAKSPYPVFVCGDFNDTPVSYAYHKMLGNLKDAFCETGNGIGYTYGGITMPFRIDYILHSNKISTSEFITEKIDYSDHFPIKCKFSITQNTAARQLLPED